MRMPSLKSWVVYGAVYAAGFATMLVYTVHFLYSIHFFHSQSSASKSVSHYPAPYLFVPQRAAFDFATVSKDGSSLKFEEFRGRVVILNIWATSCGPCLAEMPSLGKLAAHYSTNRDVAVICLSDESAAMVFKNRLARDSEAPIFSSDGHPLPDVYQTTAIPATFVIDKQGMIINEHVGAADWSDPKVIEFIDSLRQRPNTSLEPTGVGAVSSAARFTSPVAVAQLWVVRPHLAHTTKNIMKPNKLVVGLFGVGGVFGILSWVTTGTAKDWFAGISTLAMPVALIAVLAGMVAERRYDEWKTPKKKGWWPF